MAFVLLNHVLLIQLLSMKTIQYMIVETIAMQLSKQPVIRLLWDVRTQLFQVLLFQLEIELSLM